MHSIKKAGIADSKVVTELHHACTDALLAKGIPQWNYLQEQDIIRDIAFTYVLISNDEVIAAFCMKPYQEHAYYAFRIAVHPDVQGRGIGKEIVTWLKNFEHPVYLDCWNGNDKLKDFYKENGGDVIGVFPEEDYDICVFRF